MIRRATEGSTMPQQAKAGPSGFTIVELLIVIIIIGILSTIIGLNYANATKTARTSQAKANAYSVQKVAEAYYADRNRVPGTINDFSYNPLVKVPEGVTVLQGGASLSPANGQTSVEYDYLGTSSAATGGRLYYWDYGTNAPTTAPLYVGVTNTGGTWTSL